MRGTDPPPEAVAMAWNYLARRSWTAFELARRLEGRGVDPGVAEQVITYLKNRGYLDDNAYARRWVEDGKERRLVGRKRMYHELRLKGVESKIREEALKVVDEREEEISALAWVRKRLAAGGSVRHEQLARGLWRRGFSMTVVRRVMAGIRQVELDSAGGKDI